MDSTNRKNLKLQGQTPMWRSLDELANTPEFQEMVGREFPEAVGEWDDAASRRTFLKVMGASLALAGVGGCVKPTTEKIVPYVRQPEELVPGKPLYFASAATFRGYARGIVVESHEGRPTKIEGNPDHPGSLGGADVFTQAHVLGLYDPDRSQVVNFAGEVSNWNSFIKVISAELESRKSSSGQGIRLLTGTVTSPTLAWQIQTFLKNYPNAKWHQYEAVNSDNEKLGLQQAFGKIVSPVYHLDKAKIIVSLDCNFLSDLPGSVRYAREFADGRRVSIKQHKTEMNRLYVAEGTPSITGAVADERTRVKPSEILNIARAINGGDKFLNEFVQKALTDLEANRGAGLVIAGDSQPPEVHALAAVINGKLGNIGKTVEYINPVEAGASVQTQSLRELVEAMEKKEVDVLIMLGGNPAYDAPADFKFGEKLKELSTGLGKRTVHLSHYYDETSFLCQWHLPLAHELEVWSDARAYDGTATIMQPLISSLYQSKSLHVVMSMLMGAPNRGGYEILREYWGTVAGTADLGDFESAWTRWLNNGVVADSAFKPINVTQAADAEKQTAPASGGGTEMIFRPDPCIWDGRYANNGWLMELPKPLTRLVWDNVALMSPTMADKYGGRPSTHNSKPKAPMVALTHNGQTVNLPIWVLPGHPEDCITVHLGYGRNRAGRVGGNLTTQPGFNVYPLRTSATQWSASGLTINGIGETFQLSCVQNQGPDEQHAAKERYLLRVASIHTHAAPPAGHGEPGSHGYRNVSLSLYPPYPYADDVTKGNSWGMVIDQNACIGCNACVVACQAENNIPVVGKDQIGRGRDMHWLRIDTYYAGEKIEDAEGPYFQLMACQHCENAPCEVVCPANATMHDHEGTNNMVYNRCIGTRYCANNCPYKVRHFNFLSYSQDWHTTEVQKMVNNPNVTVRSRGIMEKCSYCIQRISAARITAKKEFVDGKRKHDAIYDGEVVTACQQTCPTQAIYFGNLNDKNTSNDGKGSVVRVMSLEAGNYKLLDGELQTQPRTSYLPRYTNEVHDPSKAKAAPAGHH